MSVLLTFGIALVIEGVLNVVAGNKFRSATPSYFEESFTLGSVRLSPSRRCTAFLAAPWSLAGALPGADPDLDRAGDPGHLAEPVGGGAGRGQRRGTAALAFALGSASAGVGGLDPLRALPVLPASHYDWISRLLGIVVLGGMGSLPGRWSARWSSAWPRR